MQCYKSNIEYAVKFCEFLFFNQSLLSTVHKGQSLRNIVPNDKSLLTVVCSTYTILCSLFSYSVISITSELFHLFTLYLVPDYLLPMLNFVCGLDRNDGIL